MAWPVFVAFELELLLARLPAAARLAQPLAFGGSDLEELELVLDVLLGAEVVVEEGSYFLMLAFLAGGALLAGGAGCDDAAGASCASSSDSS